MVPRAISPSGVLRAAVVVILVVASPVARAAPDPDAPAPVDPADRGELVLVERVEIQGREQVSETQVMRILDSEGVRSGTKVLLPRDRRIERVKDQLRATGYFRLVNLRVRAGEKPDSVVLVVELEERSSVSVTNLYAGSSVMTPFHGGLRVVERNFLGQAIHLGGGFVWGTLPHVSKADRQQAYRVFAEAPRVGAAPLGVLGSLYVVSASEPYRVAGAENDPDPALFRAVDYNRVGGVLGLTFPVLPQLDLGVDYGFERVSALAPEDPTWIHPDGSSIPVELDLRDGTHRHTVAHFALSYDGRDETRTVGKGGRIALDLQLSSPALGSNYEYIKLVAGGAYTFRLPWRHWVTPIVSGGQIAGTAPRFEQFYSGDLSEWTPGREMGLRYSTRNPFDVLGLGVDHRAFGAIFGRIDLEYVWPLFRRTRTRVFQGGDLFLSAGLFTLVGDREDRARRRDDGEPRVPLGLNANVGLRLETPIGTLDLSVGNLLRRLPL